MLSARHSTPTPRAEQLRTEPESLYGGEGLCSAIYIYFEATARLAVGDLAYTGLGKCVASWR